ncbi:MAG: sulfurtransferase complex subunit TusB [Pseudohongiellaceae bacterium]
MSALHVVNKPQSRSQTLRSCLRLLQPGDALLLIEDGVYACADTGENRLLWQNLPADVSCHVLQPDLDARGITLPLTAFALVEDAGFVDLVCRHDKTLSWF